MAKSLPLPLAVAMSLFVFVGSAQLAALPLIASGAPTWVVWAAALCVNLRFVVLGALWRPYFGGLPRGGCASPTSLPTELQPDPARQVPYYWGGVASNWPAWRLPSLAGIFLGERLPAAWGLGFAGTLALLGVGASLIAGRSAAVCAAVAGGPMPLGRISCLARSSSRAMAVMCRSYCAMRRRRSCREDNAHDFPSHRWS
jgi:predicted branched-subunit amino acid permease